MNIQVSSVCAPRVTKAAEFEPSGFTRETRFALLAWLSVSRYCNLLRLIPNGWRPVLSDNRCQTLRLTR